MIYLIYGLNSILIDKQIKKIIESYNIADININYYDLDNTNIKNLIDDFQTISLFEEKKVVVVNDSTIFTGSSKIELTDDNQQLLLKYFDDFNPNTIVIFSVINEKLDERKKITKLLKNNHKIIECNKIDNLPKYVKELFDAYNIDNNNINIFIDRVGNDIGIIEQEVIKIKTYKDDDLNISKEDIISLTSENINTDIFNLIETIVLKNKEKAIKIYRELIKIGEEPIKLIVMLANNIRIIYQTKEFTKKGYTEKDIAAELNIHPYRVKLAKEKSREYSSESLLNQLNKLAELDMNIKTGAIDKDLGFELFILMM